MIQFTIPYSKREKTPFQPLDTSVLTDGDILDFVLEYNYRKAKGELFNALYSVNYKREETGEVTVRNIRMEYLIQRFKKYNNEILKKYDLLLNA